MKILYIGHYREGTGWSRAAIDSILALDSSGVDVVCRNLKLTDNNKPVPQRIEELEKKSLDDADFCIQHVLPHHFSYSDKFIKNILYFVSETDTVKYSGWLNIIKSADEVWVPSTSNRNSLIKDGVKNVKIIPYAFDTSKYNKNLYKKLSFTNSDSAFKFYYIGDLNDRKNIDSIIRCYHSEFHNNENVALIIKATKLGVDPKKTSQYLHHKSKEIKERLRIWKDPSQFLPEYFLTDFLSEDLIMSLHASCDCFINISHGEGWSIPSFEAMCFGNTPICSNDGGVKDFIESNNVNTGKLVNGIYSVCNHSDPAFPTIFTGKEHWFVPSEKETKEAMRYYYENKNNIDRSSGLISAEKFSYKNVGRLMVEELEKEIP